MAALDAAGLQRGDEVVVEQLAEGELRVRRSTLTFDTAFGALTGIYPAGYLDRMDAEHEQR